MKTPKEILEEFKEEVLNWNNTKIDHALSEIDAYYKSKVPKKLNHSKHSSFNMGYNQAIDDFHKEE